MCLRVYIILYQGIRFQKCFPYVWPWNVVHILNMFRLWCPSRRWVYFKYIIRVRGMHMEDIRQNLFWIWFRFIVPVHEVYTSKILQKYSTFVVPVKGQMTAVSQTLALLSRRSLHALGTTWWQNAGEMKCLSSTWARTTPVGPHRHAWYRYTVWSCHFCSLSPLKSCTFISPLHEISSTLTQSIPVRELYTMHFRHIWNAKKHRWNLDGLCVCSWNKVQTLR